MEECVHTEGEGGFPEGVFSNDRMAGDFCGHFVADMWRKRCDHHDSVVEVFQHPGFVESDVFNHVLADMISNASHDSRGMQVVEDQDGKEGVAFEICLRSGHLHRYSGQVATTLGLTLKDLTIRLHRARRHLRELLNRIATPAPNTAVSTAYPG